MHKRWKGPQNCRAFEGEYHNLAKQHPDIVQRRHCLASGAVGFSACGLVHSLGDYGFGVDAGRELLEKRGLSLGDMGVLHSCGGSRSIARTSCSLFQLPSTEPKQP